MDFRLTGEQEAFHQEVISFIQGVLPKGWDCLDPMETAPHYLEFSRRAARELGKRGWLGLAWPREHGGWEDPLADALLAEELAYYRLPARDVQGVGMIGPTIIAFGTPEQKAQHLPPIARGEVFWCQGYSEPGAGSDLAGVALRAVEEGDYFVVNGQKTWTSFANTADWLYFLARTDPTQTRHRGISFFLSPVKAPGIQVRPIPDMAGGESLNEVYFDSLRVPRTQMLGEKNRGWYVAMALLEFERSMAAFIGVARRMLDDLAGYFRESPTVLRDSCLRQGLAQAAVETEVGRWLCYRNAWLHHKKLPFGSEPPIAKVFMSELVQRIANLGTRALGLYGALAPGSPRARLLGEMALLSESTLRETILAGTSEIQRNVIAWRGLNMPRE